MEGMRIGSLILMPTNVNFSLRVVGDESRNSQSPPRHMLNGSAESASACHTDMKDVACTPQCRRTVVPTFQRLMRSSVELQPFLR